MKKVLLVAALLALVGAPAFADSFVNGGFEAGDWSGWTTGGGYWYGGAVSPTSYLPGGGNYSPGVFGAHSAIVGVGTDPISGLPTVLDGSFAARVNNYDPNYHVSVISQTVKNYSDPFIYFAWAAVLESSHGIGDSDYFGLKLTDDTKGTTVYAVSYDSASTPGFFSYKNGWYYSPWELQSLDVSALQGDTFTLTLIGSDCPYGGHGGYVYLDGFGGTPPPVNNAPEPASMLLLGTGLVGLGARFRRRK